MSGPEALLVPAIPGRFSLRSSRDDTTASLDWSIRLPVTGGATLVGSIRYSEVSPRMNTTTAKSPDRLEPGERNLSSWTVKFERGMVGGWSWSAEHNDGRKAGPSIPGVFMSKETAEHDAVNQLERVDRGDYHEEVSGFDLQIRVRERGES